MNLTDHRITEIFSKCKKKFSKNQDELDFKGKLSSSLFTLLRI